MSSSTASVKLEEVTWFQRALVISRVLRSVQRDSFVRHDCCVCVCA
jgi:hypothetical protein